MKPYFAQYLPVEGEIKQFSKVVIDGKIDIVERYPFTDPYGDGYDIVLAEFGTQMVENCKPVKLFLCSRDIQVGDRVQYLDRGECSVIREVNDKDNIKEGGINYRQRFIVDTGEGGEKVVFQYMLDMNKCFKVIGEISPDALGYVKEGDEFGEDDIRIGAGSIMNARFHFVPFEGDDQKEWFPNNGWELYTQIKDPCGHFH